MKYNMLPAGLVVVISCVLILEVRSEFTRNINAVPNCIRPGMDEFYAEYGNDDGKKSIVDDGVNDLDLNYLSDDFVQHFGECIDEDVNDDGSCFAYGNVSGIFNSMMITIEPTSNGDEDIISIWSDPPELVSIECDGLLGGNKLHYDYDKIANNIITGRSQGILIKHPAAKRNRTLHITTGDPAYIDRMRTCDFLPQGYYHTIVNIKKGFDKIEIYGMYGSGVVVRADLRNSTTTASYTSYADNSIAIIDLPLLMSSPGSNSYYNPISDVRAGGNNSVLLLKGNPDMFFCYNENATCFVDGDIGHDYDYDCDESKGKLLTNDCTNITNINAGSCTDEDFEDYNNLVSKANHFKLMLKLELEFETTTRTFVILPPPPSIDPSSSSSSSSSMIIINSVVFSLTIVGPLFLWMILPS